MASSATAKRQPNRAGTPSILPWLLRPSTWAHRGGLVGRGLAAPIDHSGQSPTFLVFHGFCGTPHEVRILADAAHELGLAARAPLLPGHGTHIRDLQGLRFDDWVEAGRQELRNAALRGRVVLAGLSLGSVIAARLASEGHPAVSGLALFATALRLNSPYPSRWLAAAERLHLPRCLWMPKSGSNIEDPEQRPLHFGYDAEPIRAAIELYRGGVDTMARLERITCPTLLVHGALDHVCPVGNVKLVANALGTRDVTQVILERSAHVVTEDFDRATAVAALSDFLGRLSGSSMAARGPVATRTP